MNKTNFIPGNFYDVTFGNGYPNFEYKGRRPALKFNRSFPCYDVRFHGVTDNPEKYTCYEFQLPENLGVWSPYQFQIISANNCPVS